MCAMGARYLPGGRFLAVGFFLLLISAAETSAKTLPDPQQKQNAAVCNPARSDVGTSGSFVCDPTRHLSAVAAGNIDLVAKQLKDKGSAVGVAVIADLSVLAGTRPSSAQESFNVSWHCSSSATQVAREHLTSWKVEALILIGLNDKEFCVERRLGRFELGERDDAHLIAAVQELLVLKLTSHAVIQTISVLKESATHGTERRGAKSALEEPTEQEPAGTIKERVGPDSSGKVHRNFIASMLPFKGFAFPPKPGVACPKCDGIHAEMWEMQKSWESLWPSWKWEATDGLPEDQGQGTFLLARMQLGLQSICAEQQDVRWRDYMRSWVLCNRNNIGCYVATANSAPQYHQKGGAATCDKVPFREIVHTITAYALNGSNMSVEFSWNTDQLYPDRQRGSSKKFAVSDPSEIPKRVIERLRIEVPNSWFVQTAVGMQWAINALPMDLWQALKLGDTMSGPEGTQVPSAPPYPSITEAFSILMANKTLRYMEASMESWPWVPPPPPPPPTPPPCPGGSLQECMKLCPKTEAYKTCVTECLDVCLFSELHDELRKNKDELHDEVRQEKE